MSVADPPSAVAERGLVLGGETCSVELVCQVEGETCTCAVLYCTVHNLQSWKGHLHSEHALLDTNVNLYLN